MSRNNSDQMKDILNPTDNSGNAEPPQKDGPSKQRLHSDTGDEGTTHSMSGRAEHVGHQGAMHTLRSLNKMPDCLRGQLNQLSNSPEHTVLIDTVCFRAGLIAPYQRHHVWDASHVKLPHIYQPPAAHQSSHKSSHDTHHAQPSRWQVTQTVLNKLKGNFSIGDIQTAIMAYNSSYKKIWTFEALQYYGQKVNSMDNCLNTVIPKMAKLALDLPDLIQQPIPLLRRQQYRAITLSQQQISCLLANAFFCTFPHRNNTKQSSEYASFPTINFNSLFCNPMRDQEQAVKKAQKLRAIFHYFTTVTSDSSDVPPQSKPDGLVTFERISIPASQLPDWKNQKKTLKHLEISSKGSIEEEGTGMLQVDFACKYIGGGVLGSGLVQEEILFLMSPELIVARLFTEKLEDNECLKITGSQVYSLYSGYSKSFEWAGPYFDKTKRDEWKRRYRQIVAIDALNFKNPKEQYTKENIKRELNKAYVGFKGDPKTDQENLPAIATGNWGCGAFNGDPKLKALIQLMAAAVAKRDMAYFTFGNEKLAKEVQIMHHHLVDKKVTVDKLYQILKDYCGHYARDHQAKDLYRYVSEKTGSKHSLL
ncbi:poly(ADP-ribose) glycohydrolase-like [Myxocyprinus asiaticus]|uniref:poly(ADP-ribose) glycohydrolase-like n=1 Tax=Myxocyprinus asiaticus TaxID=70543 RepID=UPI0022235359|nr:poly(ADP-ribose) glycohydrolase-like [Myxocyprinus asiaticus]